MKAYLFDVDGVLSDPKLKQVTEEQLFRELIALLDKGEPVCLNTGRSLVWVQERVIDPLVERLHDKTLLKNFIGIGEKGGSWMTFDEEGNSHHEFDTSITVPKELQQKVRNVVENEFNHSMFYDTTKETMISTEMHDGFDIEAFHIDQTKLTQELEKLLEAYGATKQYTIDPTIIATDIQNEHVGKALGTERFLHFLEKNTLNPESYIAFGDSKSDFEMADELHKRGKRVSFVFVGDKEKLGEVAKPYHIEFLKGFSQGTLEYLLM